MHLELNYKGTLKLDKQTKALDSLLLYGLIGYVDSICAGNPEDHKSVMTYYSYVNRAVVS